MPLLEILPYFLKKTEHLSTEGTNFNIFLWNLSLAIITNFSTRLQSFIILLLGRCTSLFLLLEQYAGKLSSELMADAIENN
jgi:hypothetical protein